MFEYGFEKCGGCLGGIFLPWRRDNYIKKYTAKSDSMLNGYMDIDGDDPFSIDDELVSLQANNQSSYHDAEWTNGKENYYRDNKPLFQKSVSTSNTNGYKKLNGKQAAHPQKSTKSQKSVIKNKPIMKENADDDEFEEFLKNATRKSEDMKDDVQAYLQTTAENDQSDVKNGVVTSQPSNSHTDIKNTAATPIIPKPSTLD